MGEKYFKISDEIKKCVEFKKANLLKDPYPSGCNLIVCRNVMIYFTEMQSRRFIRNLIKLLKLMDAFLLVIQNRLLIIVIWDMNMTRFSFTERAKRFKFNNVTVMWFITVTLLFCIHNYLFFVGS